LDESPRRAARDNPRGASDTGTDKPMAPERPIPEGKYLKTPSGQTIHYHEAGPRRAGKPSLLFLHGSGPGASGYSNFKHNYPVLAAAGHHCLVIDYPGYGYASKPTDLDYSTPFYVQQFDEFLTALDIEQVVPIGNSLGGLLATAYTFAFPAKVPKLILMAPGGLAEASTYVPFQVGLHAMFSWVARRPTDETSFRAMLALLVHDPSALDEAAVRERYPIALEQPSEVWTRMRVGHHAERLGEIHCPILAFWGAKDKFVPVSHGAVLTQRAKNVRLIISSRCGHWYMIEEREDFNHQCLAFLSENGAT